MRLKFLYQLLLWLLLLAVVFLLQLFIGSVNIPFQDVISILITGMSHNEAWRNIVLESRLPGAVASILAGAALSVSGLQMQTMFRNPVAGPYVLGISSGASLGVAAFIMFLSSSGISHTSSVLSNTGIIFSAAVGATCIFIFNVFIAGKVQNSVTMLIVGLMIGGGINAFIEILQSFSGNEALKQYVLWTFGSFRYINSSQIVFLAIPVIAALVFSEFISRSLDMLLLGDTYAESMGLNIRNTKTQIVLATSVLAGSVTAFCGPIGFVGLAIPHLARALCRTATHRILTIHCVVMGGTICGLCNILASTPGSETVLPLNAVTSLLGAPVVVWIITRQRYIS